MEKRRFAFCCFVWLMSSVGGDFENVLVDSYISVSINFICIGVIIRQMIRRGVVFFGGG